MIYSVMDITQKNAFSTKISTVKCNDIYNFNKKAVKIENGMQQLMNCAAYNYMTFLARGFHKFIADGDGSLQKVFCVILGIWYQ